MTGRVLNIQRMSTEDGPGIRTTVFLKGCPLRCTWCHNPESMSAAAQVVVREERCIKCGSCLEVCPLECDTSVCKACGLCVDDCPTAARELLGCDWEVGNLVREVAKDRAYFKTSGGGVTISGGEPSMQAGFTGAFLARCRDEGLHTALDTCGACGPDVLTSLAGMTRLVLFDLKLFDTTRHREYTGQGNERILENLATLAAWMDGQQAPPSLWVRTPLVPGATADDTNIRDIGRFLADSVGTRLEKWELCAFNNLCREQYRRLGRTWEFATEPLMRREDLLHLQETAAASGVDPTIIRVTGASRLEE
jgi:pyruvate formate lyase activating enzyme